ncbi:macro domain-containing protein [Halobacillus sp. MO56]
MKRTIEGVVVEAIQGDIANQTDMDAVVNAANAELRTGGGVAGALHKVGGPELAEAGKQFAPISPGQAVITPAFKLPNDYVIHCLGPVYGVDKPEGELLQSCYVEALKQADEKEVGSIAFPSISTGAFGYPLKEAIPIVLNTVFNEITVLKHVKHIRFVLLSEKDLKAYESYWNKALKEK